MTADIQEIFERVGRDYEYMTNAEWAKSRDLKVKWIRSGRWIEFYVTDYLKDMDYVDLEELARMMFKRIIFGDGQGYPEGMTEYITSQEFRERNVPIYLERCTEVYEGYNHISLDDSVARLLERGLLHDADIFGVTVAYCGALEDKACRSSVLMKCALVNRALDTRITENGLIDFVVYCAVKWTTTPFPGGDTLKEMQREIMEQYPDHEKCLKDLRFRGLDIF